MVFTFFCCIHFSILIYRNMLLRGKFKGNAQYMQSRVDNDNHFTSFFVKKCLQTIIVFAKKWRDDCDNLYFVKN
jgi:hypothetical protein